MSLTGAHIQAHGALCWMQRVMFFLCVMSGNTAHARVCAVLYNIRFDALECVLITLSLYTLKFNCVIILFYLQQLSKTFSKTNNLSSFFTQKSKIRHAGLKKQVVFRDILPLKLFYLIFPSRWFMSSFNVLLHIQALIPWTLQWGKLTEKSCEHKWSIMWFSLKSWVTARPHAKQR